MDHAVGALFVIAGAVGVPVGLRHQLLEALGIALAEQIARPLPAEDVARRIAPRRAVIGLVAGEEVEEQARLAERPFGAVLGAEDAAEQFLGLAPIEKVRLVGRALVGIARRHRDAVEPGFHHRVEEARDAFRLGAVEQRAIDVDAEAARLGELDRRRGLLVDAVLAHRVVVHLLVAVEMDRPDEERIRLEAVDLLLEQQRVGAQIDELLACDDAFGDLLDLAVEQGLAAGDRDHRRAAFVDRLEALFDRQALVQDLVGIIDLAAAGAGEVAAEQRLEHENQRITLDAGQALFHHVGADADHLIERNGHGFDLPSLFYRVRSAQPAASASSGGMRKRTFSVMPGSFSHSTSLSCLRRAIRFCTNSSGAEAPAVMPTAFAPLTQAGSSASASATRYALTPCTAAISRNRLEFELLAAPTTRTTSTCCASSRTARWRFCVA